MDCRELEDRLEALLDGALDEVARRRAERHLATCAACRELLEPFTGAAVAPPDDLAGSVLERTSGSPCGRAETLLPEWVDGGLDGADRELIAAHLETCGDCRALAAVISRLAAELPRLAELRPGAGFVASVLAATLPLSVRLRRWWAAAWPRWVRRPRFASETAFVATMVLVLLFATPGSPLEAVPNSALELARADHAAKLEAPMTSLERQFETRVVEPLGAAWGRGEARARAWATTARGEIRDSAGEIAGWLGTSRDRLASLFQSADEKASESKDSETNHDQETP